MKTDHTSTIPLVYGITVGSLKKYLETFPGDATLSVSLIKGDRPWDSDTFNLSVRWSEEI